MRSHTVVDVTPSHLMRGVPVIGQTTGLLGKQPDVPALPSNVGPGYTVPVVVRQSRFTQLDVQGQVVEPPYLEP